MWVQLPPAAPALKEKFEIVKARHPIGGLAFAAFLRKSPANSPVSTQNLARNKEKMDDRGNGTMRILGIETSCDETALAVLEVKNERFFILSNIVSSQVKVHQRWGGVVPNLAKREHQRNLVWVLRGALGGAGLLKSKLKAQNAKLQFKIQEVKKILEREPELSKKLTTFLQKYEIPAIDLIAVVNGPGLEPALWVGVNFAKALAYYWEKPIIAVNHLEGHLLVNLLAFQGVENKKSKIEKFFPAVCLLVSGGHTLLVLMGGIGSYKIIGETRDDSAGECFDKSARLLGLGYPGGPMIAKAARLAQPKYQNQIRLPRPMISSKDYDFSFSGLKTAVLYHYQAQPAHARKSNHYIHAMAAEIQRAIVEVLVFKTIRAAKEYRAKSVMLGGGVAANSELRTKLQQRIEKELPGTRYLVPEAPLCTDNGVMAAVAGYFSWKRNKKTVPWQTVKAEANVKL